MGLIRPTVLNARPGIIIPVIGGVAGTLILTAGMYLAPLLGFPFIDIPHLMGGILTADPDGALVTGFWLHFVAGAILFPIVFGLVWPLLPGPMTGLVGDVIKGLSWGLGLCASILLTVGRELSDTTVRTEKELGACATYPVIVRIPVVHSPGQEHLRKWRKKAEVAAAVGLILVSIGAAIQVYFSA